MSNASIQHSVEAFLFREADLLDEWKLNDWEALLTDDATYHIPPIGVPQAETLPPESHVYVVVDDRFAIKARVERLMGHMAWAELPRSRVRHMIANVRILEDNGAELLVASNFTIYRVRRREITSYIGKNLHRLVRVGDDFRIRSKTVVLDMDVLRGQGGVSIIL